jgi:hypothetical protein
MDARFEAKAKGNTQKIHTGPVKPKNITHRYIEETKNFNTSIDIDEGVSCFGTKHNVDSLLIDTNTEQMHQNSVYNYLDAIEVTLPERIRRSTATNDFTKLFVEGSSSAPVNAAPGTTRGAGKFKLIKGSSV